MKKIRPVLCLLLSLVLAASVCISAVSVSAEDAKPVYLLLGDSIAFGAGLNYPSTSSYGAIVAATEDYEYLNDAISGHTTKELIKRLGNSEVIADVERADIISVSIGGNNFILENLPKLIYDGMVKQDYSGFDSIAAVVKTDLGEIIRIIREINPDARLTFQTLYNPRYDSLREVYQQGANRLNAVFTSYLEENPGSYELVDLSAHFDGHPEWIAKDSIHPNQYGHHEIAKLFVAKFYALGWGTQSEAVIPQEETSPNFIEMLRIRIRNLFANLKALFSVIFREK